MYSSFDIARELLNLAKRDSKRLTPMQLLKLVYIAHGFYLGMKHKPLIDSSVQAWMYGPVIPDLYHVIKRFGSGFVELDTIELYKEKELRSEDQDFLEIIWKGYKDFSGSELSARTHKVNSPWHYTYKADTPNLVIDNQIIETYYTKFLQSQEDL